MRGGRRRRDGSGLSLPPISSLESAEREPAASVCAGLVHADAVALECSVCELNFVGFLIPSPLVLWSRQCLKMVALTVAARGILGMDRRRKGSGVAGWPQQQQE